jgi:hypothetical protein
MRTTSRRILLLPLALLTCALILAPTLTAGARAEGTTTVIHFQPEGLPALEAQLKHHEVHAVTFHPTPAPGHIHVSMADGRHFTVIYAASEQEKLIALARANGARYAVAKAKAASTKTTTHHKLRYIAGGILIVVIIIVAIVLLVDRRRKLNEGGGDATTSASAPGDSAT